MTIPGGTRRDRRVAPPGVANACFFRSGPPPGARKALLKITDRCDLRCAHCFVSATSSGSDMDLADLRAAVGRLREASVANVTLTGGEPLVHPELAGFLELLVGSGFDVTVCTNAVSLSDSLLAEMVRLRRVSVNVSIDGFRAESHGHFRGDPGSFEVTVRNTRRLAAAGVLKGILSTPNALAATSEYAELFDFAGELDAQYLLLNPLSSFGRGVWARRRLAADEEGMREIAGSLQRSDTSHTEAVFIRFPNDSQPLSGCIAGEIFYVLVDGRTAVCPYLLFAARNRGSHHHEEEFIVGNLFRDPDFAARLDSYREHPLVVGNNSGCRACSLGDSCGKGCPAAVITAGGRVGDLDADVCPMMARSRS